MKPNLKLLHESELVFDNKPYTDQDREEISAFIREYKQKQRNHVVPGDESLSDKPMPDFKRLDEIDPEVVNRILTDEDRKEISAFIQEHKRKEKLKVQRKAAKKSQTANV